MKTNNDIKTEFPKRMIKRTIAVFSAALLTVSAAIALSSCTPASVFTDLKAALGITNAVEKSGDIKIMVAPADGFKITSQNPVTVTPGDKVSFDYTLDQGYIIDKIPEGAVLEDGKLTVENALYSTTLIPQVRRLGNFKVTVSSSDGGDGFDPENAGFAKITADTVKEGNGVYLTAFTSSNFEFTGWSIDTPACEGGHIFSTVDFVQVFPEADTHYIANFTRVTFPVSFTRSEGLKIRSPYKVSVKKGTDCLFMFDVEEGYIIKELPEGTTYSNGVLCVPSVLSPMDITVKTYKLSTYRVDVLTNIEGAGSAATDTGSAFVVEGKSVTISAEANRGYLFDGFSIGKPLSEGGTPTGTAGLPACTLFPESDTVIYANFSVKICTVSLELPDGATLSGTPELTTPAGGDVSFDIDVKTGYLLAEATGDGVTLTGNHITVTNILDDMTVKIVIRPKNSIKFSLETNADILGTASSDVTPGYVFADTKITLTATDGLGSFKGWSTGAPLSKGGKLLSTSKNYSFVITANTAVYANFSHPSENVTTTATKWVVQYVPNGGVYAKDSSQKIYTVTTDHTANYSEAPVNESPYRCPNALPNMGQFTREGYVLIGYNTEPDGSGSFYGPGWNIIMPESGVITLYCVWEKATPASSFVYSKASTGVTIRYYTGKDKKVVIPEYIEGTKVVTIASGVFSNCDLETLVISRFVTTVSSSAIINCKSFTTLYLYDSVTSLPDNFYTGCPEFQNVKLMAQRMPTYLSGRNGTYAVKFEWIQVAPGNKILIMSGSNSAYGINSPLLERLLQTNGRTYSVINYGQNASNAQAVFLEACEKFMKEGDILVVEPEMNQRQYGDNTWYDSTQWQMIEGCYEMINYIDIRHYNKMFSTFASFNKACSGRSAQTYETYTSDTVNAWGDYSKNKVGATDSWKNTLNNYDANGGMGSQTYSVAVAYITNEKFNAEINRIYDMYKSKGIPVLYSFPAIVKTALTSESQIAGGDDQSALMEAVDKYLHVERISVPSDYIFDRKYSYNSNYHLNTAGQTIRTENLCNDLITWMKKNGR